MLLTVPKKKKEDTFNNNNLNYQNLGFLIRFDDVSLWRNEKNSVKKNQFREYLDIFQSS